MKKYLFIFLILIFLVLLMLGFYFNKIKRNNVVAIGQNDVAINSEIAIKYQEEDGNYKDSTDGSWPDNYYLNPERSSCKSNTTIGYDTEKDKIIFKGEHPDRCKVYFDKEITIANYIKSIFVYDGYNNIYYHDGKGDYTNSDLEAGDYSYRYVGGDYSLTELGRKNYKSIYEIIVQTCDGVVQNNNYWCDSAVSFKLTYNNNTYTSIKQALETAIKDGYIQKNEVDNYVCFGSEQSPCPYDNLYRIIGLFKNNSNEYEVKLIKADYVYNDLLGNDGAYRHIGNNSLNYVGNNTGSSYYVFSSNEANFETSDLNLQNLNNNFLKNIGNYQTKIAMHSWQVAPVKHEYAITNNASTAYNYELGKNKTLKIMNAKVGLVYVSDFYYSVPSIYLTYPAQKGVFKGDIPTSEDLRIATWDNWLWLGNTEWAISISEEYVYDLDFAGLLYTSNYTSQFSVRPVFYLNTDVKIAKGNGSLESPYYIF